MFDLDTLSPEKLKKWTNTEGVLSEGFKALTIGAQLAVFRLMREKRQVKQADIDKLMDAWLKELKN